MTLLTTLYEPTESATERVYLPDLHDIAALLHTRLRARGGSVPATFDTTTSPTAEQVLRLIDLEAPMVLMDTGSLEDADLPCSAANRQTVRAAVRTIIAKRVAAQVELSFWTEEVVASGRTAEEWFNYIVNVDQPRVVQAAAECRAGEVEPDSEGAALKPEWTFNEEVLPATVRGANGQWTDTFRISHPMNREW